MTKKAEVRGIEAPGGAGTARPAARTARAQQAPNAGLAAAPQEDRRGGEGLQLSDEAAEDYGGDLQKLQNDETTDGTADDKKAREAEEKKRAEEEDKKKEIEQLQKEIEELQKKLEAQKASGDEQGARQTQNELNAAQDRLQQLVQPDGAANPVQAVQAAGAPPAGGGGRYASDPVPVNLPGNHPYYNPGTPGSPTAPGGREAPGGPAAPGTSPGPGPRAEPLNPADLKGGTPMGRELAQIAYKHATDGTGDGRHCYRNVADDLAKVGINVSGESAYMAADQLARNSKVKEVKDVSSEDLKKLPPGAIVVWNRGGGHEHGHISIAMGDGREASDVMRQQITNYGTSYRVFLPNDK